LLIALLGSWLGWREWGRWGRRHAGEDGGREGRSRFLAPLGLLTSGVAGFLHLERDIAAYLYTRP